MTNALPITDATTEKDLSLTLSSNSFEQTVDVSTSWTPEEEEAFNSMVPGTGTGPGPVPNTLKQK